MLTQKPLHLQARDRATADIRASQQEVWAQAQVRLRY